MGLSNSSDEGHKTYVNIVGGKFAIKTTEGAEGAEGAVSRLNKNNKTVHELQYDKLKNVRITGIEKKIKEGFGASWEITLREADETYILNLSYSGRQTNGLLHRLPNINLAESVSLSLFTNREGKTYLTVYNAKDEKIEAAYTKDKPNGLPPMEVRKVKGVDTYDDAKQMDFIELMIETQIQPQLKAAVEFEPEDPAFTEEEDSGLPF